MPQEQLFERGRLAGQAAQAGRAEHPDQPVELVGVHLAADPQAIGVQAVQAGQRVEPGRRPGQLGGDRRPGQVPQLGQAAGLHGAAAPDDRDPVAEHLDLGQDVAGQQHRPPSLPLLLDALAERGLHQRVEPGGRLVEQQQLHIGGERGDERDLLPVPLGVGARPDRRVELEPFDQAGPALLVKPAAEPAEQVDHLAAGEVRPEAHVAGYVREPAVQLGGLRPGVAAEQRHRPAVGAQQPEQDADRGGLARPVRAEEPVHLALRDVQVEPVKRHGLAVGLAQPGHVDCRSHASETTLNS